LQFHLEADQELIQRWLHVPEYRAEVEAAGTDHRLEHLLRDTHGHVAAARHLSEQVFSDFIALFNLPPKVRLASR
jgi:GMP synthase (glutamine-hydrolysing)